MKKSLSKNGLSILKEVLADALAPMGKTAKRASEPGASKILGKPLVDTIGIRWKSKKAREEFASQIVFLLGRGVGRKEIVPVLKALYKASRLNK